MEKQTIVAITQFGLFEVQANRFYTEKDGSCTLLYEYPSSTKAFMSISGPCVCYFKAAAVEYHSNLTK